MISIVAAIDNNNGYSKNKKLPWAISGDMNHFKTLTTNTIDKTKQNVLIMGKDTYLSMGHPLENRYNIVISKTLHGNFGYSNLHICKSVIDALLFINKHKHRFESIFVIGGRNIWYSFLDLKIVDNIIITNIKRDYQCDKYFDLSKYLKYFKIISVNENIYNYDRLNECNAQLDIINYEYQNKEEYKFMHVINKIINKGSYMMERSGVGTLSIFGKSFKYNIENNRIPLFTHRKVFLRGIIEELLFFISGKTNTKILENKNINIWKGHTSKAFLKSRNLNYEEGSYGPSYGFQLRHWGAEYDPEFGDDKIYHGFDQLKYVIDLIKHEPTSRRILFSYWNPLELKNVPLAACHVIYNFYVNVNTKELSCSFYQRSNDFALSCVFNIVSASILTIMIAHICKLKPKNVIHNIGNIHLYMNQLDVIKEMMKNKPNAFPLLYINDPKKEITHIEEFKYEDFILLNYNSHNKYNIPFSV